jgi:hypothetical protein
MIFALRWLSITLIGFVAGLILSAVVLHGYSSGQHVRSSVPVIQCFLESELSGGWRQLWKLAPYGVAIGV